MYLCFDTHLLEVGEGRITDQKCIVKDKAFGRILQRKHGRKSMSNVHSQKTADLWRDNDLQQRFQSLGTSSNASCIPRWVKIMISGCSDGSLVSGLPTQESIKFPQGASTDMISAPRDRSGAGSRALVRKFCWHLSKLLCIHLFGSILLQRSASHERIREPRDNQTVHPTCLF